jgi:SRSO17 transposase
MPEREELEKWVEDLEKMSELIRGHFTGKEVYGRAKNYVKGLLSQVDRKNSWQIAETLGDRNPDGVQYLLDRSKWDPDGVRDDLQKYVVEHFGEENSIFVVDETGFLKKGDKSVGVQRQYSGTAGRIENCQIGVFLTYATSKGHTLIDRELYLPKSWTEDKERCKEAGVPKNIEFKKKPQLAKKMLEKAFANGVPGKWLTGDSVYGDNGEFRHWLEQKKQSFVLAVSCNTYVCKDFEQLQVSTLMDRVPESDWQQLNAGNGSKGPRMYEWAKVQINSPWEEEWQRWLLIRRNLKNKEEIAYYIVFCKAETSLEEMVHVAGRRWAIEECFERAKDNVGLDQYEVRKWQGWYKHITLAMFAFSFLAVLKSKQLFKKGEFKMKTNLLSHLLSQKSSVYCSG